MNDALKSNESQECSKMTKSFDLSGCIKTGRRRTVYKSVAFQDNENPSKITPNYKFTKSKVNANLEWI